MDTWRDARSSPAPGGTTGVPAPCARWFLVAGFHPRGHPPTSFSATLTGCSSPGTADSFIRSRSWGSVSTGDDLLVSRRLSTRRSFAAEGIAATPPPLVPRPRGVCVAARSLQRCVRVLVAMHVLREARPSARGFHPDKTGVPVGGGDDTYRQTEIRRRCSSPLGTRRVVPHRSRSRGITSRSGRLDR
jgi:hypothetical protein